MQLTDFKSVAKYLHRIGAEPRSLLKAVVKEQAGLYWTDIAQIKFTKQGDVEVSNEAFKPTQAEEIAIKEELSGAQWPECIFMPEDKSLYPKEIQNAKDDDLFWFRDVNGNIIMLQLRREKRGEKSYVPYTYWSDKQFRTLEPEKALPLYGLDRIKGHTTAFVHEGAKAARNAQTIADGKLDHPWQQELSHAVHLGWIGGALSPHRTDWSVLQKYGITRVYIVADNDSPGKSAIPIISERLNCVTHSVEFSDQWPKSFDLADDFPKSMFQTIAGKSYYIGPSFRECLAPATFMTNLHTVVDDKGKVKQIPVLRHHAKQLWQYLDELELYVYVESPDIVRKKEALDAMLCNFSHSRKTSELILQSYTGRAPKMVYRPDLANQRRVISHGETGINTYIPPNIKPANGDVSPFLEFMEYLIPRKTERHNLLRWVATIIARPDLRPMFGVLLISENTGTGKSTLGEKILAPCVGIHNTAFPSEQQITESQFNAWLSQKRLAVVNEIYAGHSFKAANKLKSIITDRFVDVNKKYMPEMKMENFISIFACSNSLKALRIDSTDRRWFVPSVTEERWSKENFDNFFNWLASGGLSIIVDWAMNFGDYLKPGEIAPDSLRKQEMIDSSITEAQQHAEALAKQLNEIHEPVCVGYKSVKDWIEGQCRNRVLDSDQEIQRTMKGCGVLFSRERRYVNKYNQKIGMNVSAMQAVHGKNETEALDMAKNWIRLPSEIMNEGEI